MICLSLRNLAINWGENNITDNIIYSTGLGGSYNLIEAEQHEAIRKERELLMEWELSDPVSLDEEHDYDEFELTEEEIQHYDDVCEEYEERKRKRMFEEQEY